jgi:hypothetical protein
VKILKVEQSGKNIEVSEERPVHVLSSLLDFWKENMLEEKAIIMILCQGFADF